MPRYFEVVDELPHTPTGRLAKHRLPLDRTPEEVDMDKTSREGITGEYLHTWIGSATPDRITVGGRDLATEIMGHLTLTELAYLLVTKRQPTPDERVVLDAVLVSLADHGLTPSALAARLTYTGAPESIQGAVAAGLLGAGSVFLGPAGDTAQFLADALAPGVPSTDDELAAVAERRGRRPVSRRASAFPGSVTRCTRTATRARRASTSSRQQRGTLGPHLRLLQFVADVHATKTGKHLPINGAGAGGAALVDMGIPPASVRGFVLIARTAGLVAHLVEEAQTPIGMPL